MSEPASPATLSALRFAAVAALALTAGVVLWPFLPALVWAAIVVYATWPLYLRVRARVARESWAAGLLTAFVALGIALPVTLLLTAIAQDARGLIEDLSQWRAEGARLPEWLIGSPWFEYARERLADYQASGGGNGGGVLAGALAGLSGRVLSAAGGVALNLFRVIVMLMATFALYGQGERIAEAVRRIFELLFPTLPRLFDHVGSSVRAVVYGLIGTALVQGLLAGVGMSLAGVPSAVALGALTALLALLPAGAGFVVFVAACWLALGEQWTPAILLGIWSIVVGSIDALLRPILISGQTPIPFLLVFLGVFGGLASFGLIGLFVGPVVLSAAFTLAYDLSRAEERPSSAS